MKKIVKNIFDFAGSQLLLTTATILAFWIKFNIVLFTYKPYTATKIFFPLFLLIIAFYLLRHFDRKLLFDPRIILLAAVAITFLVPIGYLSHPHDWGIYKEKFLTIISFFTLYFSAILLDSRGKKYLLFSVYAFCLIALGYLLLQVHFHWSYEMGHFRNPDPRYRPFGIMDDPDHSAGIYIIGFFFSFALGCYKRKYFLLSPFALLFLYAILKSQAAGAVFGLLGGMVVFITGLGIVFINQLTAKKLFIVMWLAWLSLFILMIAFIGIYKNNVFGIADLISMYKSKNTVLYRFDLIMLAKNIFFEHPMVGVGFANDFNPAIIKMYKSSGMIIRRYLHIHTTYLSALSTTGLLGFLSLCSLVTLSVWAYSRSFILQKSRMAKVIVLAGFSLFISIQTLSYSLQYLYSISFWFSILLPFLFLDFEDPKTG